MVYMSIYSDITHRFAFTELEEAISDRYMKSKSKR